MKDILLVIILIVAILFVFTFDTSESTCVSKGIVGEEVVKNSCSKTIYAPPGVKVVDVRFRYSEMSRLCDNW